MSTTREQLTFEFLEALFEARERDPLPTHWVELEAIWQHVIAKHGGSLNQEVANAAFRHLYADRLINQVQGAGQRKIQINRARRRHLPPNEKRPWQGGKRSAG